MPLAEFYDGIDKSAFFLNPNLLSGFLGTELGADFKKQVCKNRVQQLTSHETNSGRNRHSATNGQEHRYLCRRSSSSLLRHSASCAFALLPSFDCRRHAAHLSRNGWRARPWRRWWQRRPWWPRGPRPRWPWRQFPPRQPWRQQPQRLRCW
jgi:hypothetical protein